MKKFILLSLLCLSISYVSNAQLGGEIQFGTYGMYCSDLYVVLHTSNGGESDPIPVNANTNTQYDYNNYNGQNITWVTDPGVWDGSSVNWTFTTADIYNCVGSQSSGGSCGIYDFLSTGPTQWQGTVCFEYSTSCSSCSSSQVIHMEFNIHGPGNAELLISQ